MGILTDNVKTYDRTYRGLRGVDFSSDHTQVIPTRFSYMQNMYKDYQSSQGIAVETIAGYRRRFVAPPEIVDGKNVAEIYGIHEWVGEIDGVQTRRVLVHAGSKLWEWKNYPKSVNVEMSGVLVVPTATSMIDGIGTFDFINLDITVAEIVSIKTADGTDITACATLTTTEDEYYNEVPDGNIQIISSIIAESDVLAIVYKEGVLTISFPTTESLLSQQMNKQRSISFSFGKAFCILDGRSFMVITSGNVYSPYTYINKIQSGSNANSGIKFEQRNLLSETTRQSFIADGTTKTFALTKEEDTMFVDDIECYLYGIECEPSDFTIDYIARTVTFLTIPPLPQETMKKAMVYNAVAEEQVRIDKATDTYVFGTGSTATGKKIFGLIKATDEDKNYTGKTITVGNLTLTIVGVEFYASDYAGIVLESRRPHIIKNLGEFYGDYSPKNGRFGNSVSAQIGKCTLACVYDGRVFLSGNPDFPNVVFYNTRTKNGDIDPTYFGEYCFFKVGSDKSPITALLPIADTLVVLKGDTRQEASIYYYRGQDTTDDINPRIYVGEQGLGGLGCVGGCVNFLDDPIFVSRLGIEAIGQLSVRLERTVEHRSSLIDQRLLNLDLTKAQLAEWNGYMAVLIDGQIFLADSRQMYRNEQGILQYEWYYLNDIGVYEGQFYEYKYAKEISEAVSASTIDYEGIEYPIELIADETLYGAVANEISEADGTDGAIFESKAIPVVVDDTTVYVEIYCKIDTVNNKAYLCERAGNKTGGVFKPATYIKNIDDNIFFGTNNGVVCSFNFDMRGTDREIPTKYYTFDDRTIVSGCATCMDNCDIPNLTKSTVKKSVVLKTKSFGRSAVKVKVRTNRKNYTAIENEVKPYNLFERINNSVFDFDSVDFSDMSFNTFGQSLFTLHEREKQWVEKQFYIYSDEYMRPFGFYYLSYRFTVAGKLKA